MAEGPVKDMDGAMVANRELAASGRLAAEQQTALELLVMGKSITQTAREAGVARSTLYQWMRNDPVFQAAYNQWQDQMEEGCRARLLTLTDKATDAIEKALENGDSRAALQLLKGMGLIGRKAVGLTDAEEIRGKAEMEKERKRAAERMRKADLELEEMMGEM